MKTMTTKKIALTGILAALLIGGKWALSMVANVEIVTILLASFAFVFGPAVSLLATAALVLEEFSVWGFNTWVISYLIYWPLVAAVFSLLGALLKKTKPLKLAVTATIAATLLTVFFGVLTSLIDVGLLSGNFQNFWHKFAVMYGRGILFFVIHTVCNFVLFALAFAPLTKLLSRLKTNIYAPDKL